MTEQTCATCIYGAGERCHWPYRSDDDDDGSWFASPGAMPEWAEDAITARNGAHVDDGICALCFAFEDAAAIRALETSAAIAAEEI